MNQKETYLTSSQVRNKTLLSLFFLFLFFGGCIAVWKWLHHQPEQDEAPRPLRSVLTANESIFTSFFGNSRLTKTYPPSAIVPKARINGNYGLSGGFDPVSWKLQLVRDAGDTLLISLDEIKALPKTEIIFDFKCIEGWSQVTHWGGVRFSDFVEHYGLQKQAALRFTGMVTPDGEYYVGLENKSMMHPQTLLCYEMNGKPLALNQGYPLRLIIPVKYGVKNLKRIGTLFFSDQRPPDYWHERGYDYYCGL